MENAKQETAPEITSDTGAIPNPNPKPHQTIEHVTIINTPIEIVWETLIDIDNWDWNKWARLDFTETPKAGLKGTTRVCFDGNDRGWNEFQIQIAEVDKENYTLAWKGGVPCLVSGYHSMRLEKIEETKTKIVHREDFGGLLPMLRLGIPFQKVDRNYLLMNEALKKHVEEKIKD